MTRVVKRKIYAKKWNGGVEVKSLSAARVRVVLTGLRGETDVYPTSCNHQQ